MIRATRGHIRELEKKKRRKEKREKSLQIIESTNHRVYKSNTLRFSNTDDDCNEDDCKINHEDDCN